MKKGLIWMVMAGLAAGCCGSAALAVEEHLPPSITVEGTGKVFARPNLAQIDVGVENTASSAQAALAANTASMNALMASIKQLGIPEKDVLTSEFNVQPEYRDMSQSNKRPQIVGYRVTNQVHVKVRKMDQLGTVLDTLVRSGANNVNSVSFSVDEPEKLLDAVRGAAVAEAHRKAELYAQAAGAKLGRVLYINEQGARPMPPPRFGFAMQAAAMNAPVPIAAGETELDTSVTVVYALGE